MRSEISVASLPRSVRKPTRLFRQQACVFMDDERSSCMMNTSNHRAAVSAPWSRAESHRVLTTREEAMIGTWVWPKLNYRQVIGLRPRTTTSTPSIISECPRIEERHSGQRSHLPAALEGCLIS